MVCLATACGNACGYHLVRMDAAKVWLRWAAVLPAAVVAMVIVSGVAKLFFEFFGPDWMQFLPPDTVRRLVEALVSPVALIATASRIAPSYKLHVAAAFFILFLLFFGASNYAYATLVMRGARGSWLELLAQLALGILGAVLAMRDAYTNELATRRESTVVVEPAGRA